MSFIRFWMGFTVFGLAVTISILYWAIRARQFKEADRAAHLPLANLRGEPVPETMGRDAKVLVGILCLGIIMLAASVVVSLDPW